MKTMMKLFLACLVLVSIPVSAQMNALPSERHLLVYGEAEARAIPDRFKITVSFNVVDPSVDIARRKVETQLAAVLKALDQAGVPDGEVVATSLEIEPRERYDAKSEAEVYEGMAVSREVTARFSDIDALEAFIGGLQTSKELTVSGITTSLEAEPAAGPMAISGSAGTRVTSLTRSWSPGVV
ncbi:SIMPL domain-containing protein [Arenimonas alkanexedens]